MELTARQGKLLSAIVKEYIDSAQPVSSKALLKKHGFSLSPATIRSEMQRLTDQGFLSQPHTSAGRVPTDKGYRFYVDNPDESRRDKANKQLTPFGMGTGDSFAFFQEFTRKIADLTDELALSYFPEEDVIFKEGWENIFKAPEFENTDMASEFAEMVGNMEKNIQEFMATDFPRIFIGRENPLPHGREFSIVISKVSFPKKKKGVVALLGPKRMDYDKNVKIINSFNIKKNVRKKRTGKRK
jgi:heat-inducible transcriptional repressor